MPALSSQIPSHRGIHHHHRWLSKRRPSWAKTWIEGKSSTTTKRYVAHV